MRVFGLCTRLADASDLGPIADIGTNSFDLCDFATPIMAGRYTTLIGGIDGSRASTVTLLPLMPAILQVTSALATLHVHISLISFPGLGLPIEVREEMSILRLLAQ